MKQDTHFSAVEIISKNPERLPDITASDSFAEIEVALLTGGRDKPYAFGMATELISKGVSLDLIGSDDLDCPEFRDKAGVHFLNLRGDQSSDVGFARKTLRVASYYAGLVRYAAHAKPRIFHILWNNKFLNFDRTVLMFYYKRLRKKVVLTVHNVNAGIRDSNDSPLNRLTLRIQYRLSDHIFVHTEQMKRELSAGFGVGESKITVIPFGINNAVPNTPLTPSEARQRLGISDDKKTILFFGNIAPYKGVEYLIAAFQQLQAQGYDYRLIIAGRPKDCESYWSAIRETIRDDVQKGRILLRADYIPDDETETYFKAAHVLVLPYRHIYQSGVLFLGYSFGLPVLAADVGALKEEIVEGTTGFAFKPENPADLASTIQRYFSSDLFQNLDARRQQIKDFATEKHSWDVVGQMTISTYVNLLQRGSAREIPTHKASKTSLDAKVPS